MIDKFPEYCQAFLNAFYEAKSHSNCSAREKLNSLKQSFDLVDSLCSVEYDDSCTVEDVLKAYEFYILTKLKIL